MITQLLTRVSSRKVCQAYVFIDVKRAFDNVITPVLTEDAEALTERNLQELGLSTEQAREVHNGLG
eukprot:1364723-Amphidinium_carterae.1